MFTLKYVLIILVLLLFGCSSDEQPTKSQTGAVVDQPADNTPVVTEEPPANEPVVAPPLPIEEPPPTNPVAFSYPPGITSFGNITYINSAKLIGLGGNNTSLGQIITINPADPTAYVSTTNNNFFVNHGSETAWDGANLWSTTYGWSNGVPQSFVVKLAADGTIETQIPCPASSYGGYCEGLAWDGSGFWSSSNENFSLVRFTPDGTVTKTIPNVFKSVLSTRTIAYNSITGYLLIIEGHYGAWYNLETEAFSPQLLTIFPISGAFDAENSCLWAADNSTLKIVPVRVDPAVWPITP